MMQHQSRNIGCGEEGMWFRIRGQAPAFLYAARRVFFVAAYSGFLEEDQAASLRIRRGLEVTGGPMSGWFS